PRRGQRPPRSPRRSARSRRGAGRPPGPATEPPRACTPAAGPRTAGSQGLRQGCPEHLIAGRDEGPGHAAGEVRDGAAVDLELSGGEGGGTEPEQRGGATLPRRPAPIERGVVARERLDGGPETAEREQQAPSLGLLHRGAGRGRARRDGGSARDAVASAMRAI